MGLVNGEGSLSMECSCGAILGFYSLGELSPSARYYAGKWVLRHTLEARDDRCHRGMMLSRKGEKATMHSKEGIRALIGQFSPRALNEYDGRGAGEGGAEEAQRRVVPTTAPNELADAPVRMDIYSGGARLFLHPYSDRKGWVRLVDYTGNVYFHGKAENVDKHIDKMLKTEKYQIVPIMPKLLPATTTSWNSIVGTVRHCAICKGYKVFRYGKCSECKTLEAGLVLKYCQDCGHSTWQKGNICVECGALTYLDEDELHPASLLPIKEGESI